MNSDTNSKEKLVIDATNKTLGRLASEVAFILGGKKRRDYAFEKTPAIKVKVENASRIKISIKKLKNNTYYHYSGYPGGMKKATLEKLFNQNPERLVRQTIRKMLPNNKQRKNILKNLVITR